jgi:hypothetical protein
MRNRLRRELRLELNGRTVMVEGRPTYDADPASITIGFSSIGGSLSEPRFHGRILEVERLPVPLSIVRSDRPLHLELELPSNQASLTEPILTMSSDPGAQDLFTITYLSGSRISLGFATTGGIRIRGAPVPAKPGVIHTLELATRGRELVMMLDGRDALALPKEAMASGQVEVGRLGINATDLTFARARFTGPLLSPVAAPPVRPTPPAAPTGAFRVVAILPTGKRGVIEPFIVTGRTGKGDVVYVKYTDDTHIQFGYDHWGVGGSISEPIAVDYARPHEFEIGLGSLYPERQDAAWMDLPTEVRQRLRQQATVSLDGIAVWECKSPAYPSAPADIRVGENRIGASSCTTDFTGEILEVGRAKP